MKKLTAVLVAVCGLFTSTHFAGAQGTAFTYQGNLNSGGSPVTGVFDLTFAVYTTAIGGSQTGNTYTNLAVGVTNGLFTVTLDFDGSAPFNGSIYYLQIGVRTNGAISYQPLSPRQQITPTPYAITAENLDGSVLASQLTGTLPTGLFSGTYGNAVTLNNAGNTINGSFSGNFSGSGTGLTGVALLAGGNTLSGNQTIDGRLDVFDGSFVASNYTDVVIGPGGYTDGEQHSINFDDSVGHIGSLNMGYNGTYSYFSVGNLFTVGGAHQTNTTEFTILGNGNVGIGTNNPHATLDVIGTIRATNYIGVAGVLLSATNVPVSITTPTFTSAASTFTKVADVATFTKSTGATVEITFNGRTAVNVWNSALGADFELRVDGNGSPIGRARATVMPTDNGTSGVPVSMTGIFTGLSAGSHTVSLWVISYSGTISGVVVNPGGFSAAHLLINEYQ